MNKKVEVWVHGTLAGVGVVLMSLGTLALGLWIGYLVGKELFL